MDENKSTEIYLTGVGGQGTILAADILAHIAMKSGYDVKVSEIHGMSQRGGSVQTMVRFGQNVHSMIVEKGNADILVSFETTEALRRLDYLKPDGKIYASTETIKPIPVLAGRAMMPNNPHKQLEAKGAHLIPAVELATEAGTPKASNVVLLGALAKALPFNHDDWIQVIKERVPAKFVEINIKAFELGYCFEG